MREVEGLRNFMHKYWPEVTSDLLSAEQMERLILVKERHHD